MTAFFKPNLDKRDKGVVILSHIYLLVGCASTVWLSSISGTNTLLSRAGGILAIGCGDALASTIGKRFGRHKWWGTRKSIQGTMAFVGGVFVVSHALSRVTGEGQEISHLISYSMAAVMEAFSEQNDNLVVPIFMHSCFVFLQ